MADRWVVNTSPLCDFYAIESDFAAKVGSRLDTAIDAAGPMTAP